MHRIFTSGIQHLLVMIETAPTTIKHGVAASYSGGYVFSLYHVEAQRSWA